MLETNVWGTFLISLLTISLALTSVLKFMFMSRPTREVSLSLPIVDLNSVLCLVKAEKV